VANNFSGTNIVYPSGKTYRFNKSVAQSTTIDSDGDGIMNRFDPTPFLTGENVKVSVNVVKQPAPRTLVSWYAPARSANFLYSSTDLVNPTWTLVTNFVQGAVSGKVTMTDVSKPSGPCYYRVRIDLP
jgi:hypothetical protein